MNLVENPSALEPVPDSYPGLKKGEVSTGTTIMAIPFKDGVILGADSRTSTGSYVANRTTDKIVQLSEHIFACRSGSAADTQALTDYVRFYLQQLSYVKSCFVLWILMHPSLIVLWLNLSLFIYCTAASKQAEPRVSRWRLI